MKKNVTIITNNKMVFDKYNTKYYIKYVEDTLLEVLKVTRNKIHEGHRLLTHPLSGSVKPNETVFKSIMISNEKGTLNMESLLIIEAALETAEKFISIKEPPNWKDEVLADFMEIDCTLIESGIESMRGF